MDNHEYANIIYKGLLADELFCTGGQRNDDIVDYCIAAVLDGLDDNVAFEQLVDWAFATYNKLIAKGLMAKPSESIMRDLLEEHFDRIMPYAHVWIRRGEWQEKLLHSYDWDK